MLSFDLNEFIAEELRRGDRPPDGMLHPSSIVAPLRHVQLEMAGAPMKPDTIASKLRLQTGTMWHDWLGERLEKRRVPVMREIAADPGLPEGWAGTADFLFWNERHSAFQLVDLKTTKGEGIDFIHRFGTKEEHLWQVSAYWHAFVAMGYPMYDEFGVYYLPMNEDYKVDGGVEPVLMECQPIDELLVRSQMEDRKAAVDRYLASLDGDVSCWQHEPWAYYDSPELAPEQPREQKLFKEKGNYNVVLVPHWSSMFCPFDVELCDCSYSTEDSKTTKIGQWRRYMDDGSWYYEPRQGYEEYEPTVLPKGTIARA